LVKNLLKKTKELELLKIFLTKWYRRVPAEVICLNAAVSVSQQNKVVYYSKVVSCSGNSQQCGHLVGIVIVL